MCVCVCACVCVCVCVFCNGFNTEVWMIGGTVACLRVR